MEQDGARIKEFIFYLYLSSEKKDNDRYRDYYGMDPERAVKGTTALSLSLSLSSPSGARDGEFTLHSRFFHSLPRLSPSRQQPATAVAAAAPSRKMKRPLHRHPSFPQ